MSILREAVSCIVVFCAGWFTKKDEAQPAPLKTDPKPVLTPSADVLKPEPLEETNEAPDLGVTIDIHDVLERLPRIMKALSKIKKSDPSVYDLFARIGAPTMGTEARMFGKEINPQFIEKKPMLRGVFFGGPEYDEQSAKDDTMPCAAAYMQRIDRPGLVARIPGCTTYKVGMLYMDGRKHFALNAMVGMEPNGTAHILPELCETSQVIRHKDKRGGTSFVRKMAMRKPDWPDVIDEKSGRTKEEKMQEFVNLLSWAKLPDDHILVRASKGGVAAAFAIDRKDGKRFFRQRESGTASDGKRKRILHYVEGHDRIAKGKKSYVRPHYRGDREFSWMGYAIKVSGLGFHHTNVFEAQFGAVDSGMARPLEKLMSTEEMAKIAAAIYDERRGING